MSAVTVTAAAALTGEQWLWIVVVSIMLALSLITVVVSVCSRWGADCYEEPQVYDRARDRQWDVDEVNLTVSADPAARVGLPGAGLPGVVRDPLAVDHAWCAAHDEGECDDLVCCCVDATVPCPGTVALGCGHDGVVVCHDHRSWCSACRVERRNDLDRVPSW